MLKLVKSVSIYVYFLLILFYGYGLNHPGAARIIVKTVLAVAVSVSKVIA